VRIASEELSAEITSLGAELQWLRDRDGRDLLWNGDPAWWMGRAPLLFPIVGKVPGDQVMIDGKLFPLPKHGFARVSDFTLIDAKAQRVAFELRSNASTRALYPFDFVLRVTYAIDGATLSTRAVVANEGAEMMPVSFGYHPAFRWPLPYDERRGDYEFIFERDEPGAIRGLASELILDVPRPSPVEGRRLGINDEMFEPGALIFTQLSSRSVTYGAAGIPFLRVDFPDMPQLGIWTKPGAPYVCIEPWSGYAAPVGFSGELGDKPGTTLLAPGQSRIFAMDISLLL
jgi:galactose mutarotase-like enzyme